MFNFNLAFLFASVSDRSRLNFVIQGLNFIMLFVKLPIGCVIGMQLQI